VGPRAALSDRVHLSIETFRTPDGLEFREQGYGSAIREWRAGNKASARSDVSSDERDPVP